MMAVFMRLRCTIRYTLLVTYCFLQHGFATVTRLTGKREVLMLTPVGVGRARTSLEAWVMENTGTHAHVHAWAHVRLDVHARVHMRIGTCMRRRVRT